MPSKSEDQHVPGGARDASCKTTEESEEEEQPTQPAFLQDEDEPTEGSAMSGQESVDATSIGDNLTGDSQEEVIIHMKEEEKESLC